eukprot:765542-Hanusia_phi.AAC.2
MTSARRELMLSCAVFPFFGMLVLLLACSKVFFFNPTPSLPPSGRGEPFGNTTPFLSYILRGVLGVRYFNTLLIVGNRRGIAVYVGWGGVGWGPRAVSLVKMRVGEAREAEEEREGAPWPRSLKSRLCFNLRIVKAVNRSLRAREAQPCNPQKKRRAISNSVAVVTGGSDVNASDAAGRSS